VETRDGEPPPLLSSPSRDGVHFHSTEASELTAPSEQSTSDLYFVFSPVNKLNRFAFSLFFFFSYVSYRKLGELPKLQVHLCLTLASEAKAT